MTTVAMLRELYPDLVMNLSLNGISLNGLTQIQKYQLIEQAKKEGMETGIQDLSIYLPGAQVLNLEFKRPKGGKQSPDQVAIQSKLEAMGHNYHLIRDSYEVFHLIAKLTTDEYRVAAFKQLDDTIITKFGKKLLRGIYKLTKEQL
jgi:hypothetical protein